MSSSSGAPLRGSSHARRGLVGVAVVALVVAAASARVVWSGEREIALSTDELRAGHAIEAAQHARRAAGWYAPGAPHVRVAYARLIALATTAEGLGDADTSLFAWRAIRTAALDSRWLVTPHADDLERANVAIARLAAAVPRPPGTRTDPPAEVRRAQLAALGRDDAPDVGWIVALVAGAAAVGVGALVLARRGVTATGQVLKGPARLGGAIAALGAALYLLALWRA